MGERQRLAKRSQRIDSPRDEVVTTIDLAAMTEIAVHQASVQTDTDGTRQASLLVAPGTTAMMTLADGSQVPLESISVRATEYTVGSAGRAAMPATLPPSSQYTYAVELSVDEADMQGATSVAFTQPIALYVQNFLGMPVGALIPVGYYDTVKHAWMGEQHGHVLKITSISSGMANIDLSGDGAPESIADLAAIGIDANERESLAALYAAGAELWRARVSHFSTYDLNWPPEENGESPEARAERKRLRNSKCITGSTIDVHNQVLGERVPIAGTPYSLNYNSGSVEGRSHGVHFELTGSTLPADLDEVRLDVRIAGQRHVYTFAPTTNLTYDFVWDGLDGFAREVQGTQTLNAIVRFFYPAAYAFCVYGVGNDARFSRAPTEGCPSSATSTMTVTRPYERVQQLDIPLGGMNPKGFGFGSWTLDVHHAVDLKENSVQLGSGGHIDGAAFTVADNFAGDGQRCASGPCGDGGLAKDAQVSPYSLVAGPDGLLYFWDYAITSGDERIRRVERDGTIRTIVGGGQNPFSDTPANLAEINLSSFTLAPDGSIWLLEHQVSLTGLAPGPRVRRVGSDGMIQTVAGEINVAGCADGDGGKAIDAEVGSSPRAPQSIAVSADGSVYFTDRYCTAPAYRIRRITPDGIIDGFAGFGTLDPQDGVPAMDLRGFPSGVRALAASPTGDVYVATWNDAASVEQILRIGADGVVNVVVGTTDTSFPLGLSFGDGGLAKDAGISQPRTMAFSSTGDLTFSEAYNAACGYPPTVIRRVSKGRIARIAGALNSDCFVPAPNKPYPEPGFPQKGTFLHQPGYAVEMAVADDGSMFVIGSEADWTSGHIARLAPPDRPEVVQLRVPSTDGKRVFTFDASGKHLTTSNALTGAVREQFVYGAGGTLAAIVDGDGNTTQIERDIDGAPTAIVGPYGHRTELTIVDGLLTTILDPNGGAHELTYVDDTALLETFERPTGAVSTLSYSASGRLLIDEDAAGGSKTLTRTSAANLVTLEVETAEGRIATYEAEDLVTGGETRTTTHPNGLTTETEYRDDGDRVAVAPNGTQTRTTLRPDPRFGMNAPLAVRREIETPGGLLRVEEHTRDVTMGELDPLDGPRVQTQTDERSINGQTRVTVFDGDALTMTRTSAAGRVLTQQLDVRGRVLESSLEGIEPVRYAYDSNGRLASISQGAAANERRYVFAYGTDGKLAEAIDPLGRRTSLTWDAGARLIGATLPGDRTLQFGHDANGNVTSVTPPGQPVHELDYTPVDLLDEYRPPNVLAGTDATSFDYSFDRELELVTRPDGQSIDPAYDTAGRRSSLAFSAGTLSYAYNSTTGELDSISGPGAEGLAFTHDGALELSTTWSGTVTGSVERVFDDFLRVDERRVNGGTPTFMSYDADGLLVSSTPVGLGRSSSTGMVTLISVPTVTTTLAYDPFGDLSEMNTAAIDFNLTFTRDKLSRITTLVETFGAATTTKAFEYSEAGQLQQVTTNGTVTANYTYDDNGNRLSGPASSTTYVVDDQDRLLTAGTLSFTYTANGELASIIDSATSDVTSLVYDTLGNLNELTLPNGDVVEYVTDALQRRVGKSVNGTFERAWLYDGPLRIAAELDSSNAVKSVFFYGTRENVPDAMVTGGVTYRIITDHLGSVRFVVNAATAAIAQELTYDEFGNVIVDTNPAFQPFGFAGGLYDPDTQLTRFGARDYDARTGRWTAKDPIGFAGGVNLYAYVGNDPVNRVDPMGLLSKQFGLDLLGGCGSFKRGVAISIDSTDWQVNIADAILDCRLVRLECKTYCAEKYDDICGDSESDPECQCDDVFLECVRGNLTVPGDVCANPALEGIFERLFEDLAPWNFGGLDTGMSTEP
jgi:RHS repeat-associated protein